MIFSFRRCGRPTLLLWIPLNQQSVSKVSYDEIVTFKFWAFRFLFDSSCTNNLKCTQLIHSNALKKCCVNLPLTNSFIAALACLPVWTLWVHAIGHYRGHPVTKFCLLVHRYITVCLLGLFAVWHHRLIHIPKTRCLGPLICVPGNEQLLAATHILGLIAQNDLRNCHVNVLQSDDMCAWAAKRLDLIMVYSMWDGMLLWVNRRHQFPLSHFIIHSYITYSVMYSIVWSFS